jgi:hypothetical protein
MQRTFTTKLRRITNQQFDTRQSVAAVRAELLQRTFTTRPRLTEVMEQEELMATGVYDHRSSLDSLKRAALVPSWWAVAVLSWDHVMQGRVRTVLRCLLMGPLGFFDV